MEGQWDQRRQRIWGWKDITKEAKDKDGLFQFKLHFLIFLIASTLHYCVFLEILLRNSSLPLLLFLPLLCGWGSSQHSVEMPTAGAKFNSKSKHKQCLRIETPLRFTQLQFYQFPPGKDFPLKLLCIQVHSGMQVWVSGVGRFTYRMNTFWT